MTENDKHIFNSEEFLENMFDAAKNTFCDGIYVLSDQHPCGWDFISFENFEVESDLWEQPIDSTDVSGGCYSFSDFEDSTVQMVLDKVGEEGWCFEKSGVDSLK